MTAVSLYKRRSNSLVFAALIVQLWATFAAAASELPEPVRHALRREGIPAQNVSLYIQEVSGSGPLLAVREGIPRNPASVIKLLTTLVSLDRLTPGHTWHTEAYLHGALRQGRLDGDLIIKGYGDPFLTPAAFWELVRGLRERGLRKIQGDLILDNSVFEIPGQERGDFDGQPHRVYNALPAALSLNFQATRLHLLPHEEAGRVRVFSDPPLANLTINNRLRLVKDRCRASHRRPAVIISQDDAGATVKLHGSYSVRCPESSITRLLMDPSQHVGGAFRSMWAETGGHLEGRTRTGMVPADATLFFALQSRPLGEAILGMNKYSNNLMSRLLLLTLGAEVYGEPGTVAKGRMVVADWLHDQEMEFSELVLDNGAGLSRDTRISAESVGRLLLAAYRGPYMPEFMASLAVAGVDGTMRERLDGDGLTGRAHIKTGSLDDVSTMAGYVLDREGRRRIAVMLINHPGITSWQGKRVQDALLRWVFYGAGGSPARSKQTVSGAAGECRPSLAAEASLEEPVPGVDSSL